MQLDQISRGQDVLAGVVVFDALIAHHQLIGLEIRLRERGAFRGWLCRIAWRLALDKQRGTRRRERRELAVVQGPPERNAEQMAASNEFERHLAAAMDELPEKLRQALVLAAIQGHSMREVAEILNLPEGTVKSRVHLARKQLTEKLQWLAKDLKKA